MSWVASTSCQAKSNCQSGFVWLTSLYWNLLQPLYIYCYYYDLVTLYKHYTKLHAGSNHTSSFHLDLLHLIFLDWSVGRLIRWLIGWFLGWLVDGLKNIFNHKSDQIFHYTGQTRQTRHSTSFWFIFIFILKIFIYFYWNSKLCFSKASISCNSVTPNPYPTSCYTRQVGYSPYLSLVHPHLPLNILSF